MEPLTPAVFHILLALSTGERHGYGVMQEVAAETNHSFTMGPGTLYGTLKRLLEAGMVEECGERADPEMNEERRRYYRITATGRDAAVQEARRLEKLVRSAKARFLLARTKVKGA